MIGVVILNFNSADDTISCTRAIIASTTVPYRIYIVDGCSTDNSYNFLLQYFEGKSNVYVFRTEVNGGYSYGNNIGIEKANCDGADVFFIVNPDVLVKGNAIDLMYTELMQDDMLAVVGPRIIDISNKNMQFASKLYTLSSFLVSKKPLAYIYSNSIHNLRFYKYDPEEDFKFQGMVSGCCFMIKAKEFSLISYFDSRVFLFYEEDIIAYKLFKINKLTKILSNAIVVHNHSTTIKKEGSAFIRFHRYYSSQFVLKEYAQISKIQYIFVSLFHIIPFTFNSLYSKSYRTLYSAFLKKIISLY